MKKIIKRLNTRKTVYLPVDVVARIEILAAKDNRTFSSWVALLLEKSVNAK